MDEGTLGLAAERVLQGGLPHRDFADVYTGGLARFDALVFEILGTRLIALRLAMFVVFLLWVPAVYYIARRFAGRPGAALVTLLCVAWSIPTYSAAMPSWYNLFLATFGTAALMRFTEVRRQRWLIVAGVAGGLSVIIKIVGFYYIAAALVFFAFDEHWMAMRVPGATDARRGHGYAILLTGVCIPFILALIQLVRPVPGEAKFLYFVVPQAGLAGLLCLTEWQSPGVERVVKRMRRLAGVVGPFALGLALPVALFAYAYVASGSLAALIHGVFVSPSKRLDFAVKAPPPLRTVPVALLWFLLLVPFGARAAVRQRARQWPILAAYAVIFAVLTVTTTGGGWTYLAVWVAVYLAAPSAVLAGCLLLARANTARVGDTVPHREQLCVLLCMTALYSLVQVPFAHPYYVLYSAPIAILALLAVVTVQPSRLGPRAVVVAAFFLVFAVAAVNPGLITLQNGAVVSRDHSARVPLAIPRTGLMGDSVEGKDYERVTALLREHSAPGTFIYAGPDSPELYFLSQRRDPFRTMFEFFDDSLVHDRRVTTTIDSLRITAVAINRARVFSRPLDPTLDAALRARFPDSVVVANFTVRWRQLQ